MNEKQLTIADFQRLERKIDLLNDKIDRVMEVRGIELQKTPDIIAKEEKKARRLRERQQAKILEKEYSKGHIERFKSDILLRHTLGRALQQRFDLLNIPSADRIREYQRTDSPGAFDGLKRKT